LPRDPGSSGSLGQRRFKSRVQRRRLRIRAPSHASRNHDWALSRTTSMRPTSSSRRADCCARWPSTAATAVGVPPDPRRWCLLRGSWPLEVAARFYSLAVSVLSEKVARHEQLALSLLRRSYTFWRAYCDEESRRENA
jgi:hypothetical protein